MNDTVILRFKTEDDAIPGFLKKLVDTLEAHNGPPGSLTVTGHVTLATGLEGAIRIVEILRESGGGHAELVS